MAALRPLTVMGLNSGTSMDGIDAAVFRIVPLQSTGKNNGHATAQRLDVEMIESLLYPIEPELRRKMQSIVASGHCSLEDICRLNVALGEVFAQAALALMKKSNLSRADIDIIGSHGQTIWHAPDLKKFAGIATRATLQLGEPAVIAARTGIAVVTDFRGRDMALDGQGAPLVAFADEVLFGAAGAAVGVLNLGGIANITIINEHGDAIMAFDTGPGNMLIDRAMEKLFQQPFDEGGKIAASGKTNQNWLSELAQQPYFKQEPPKTTGRELFGFSYGDDLLSQAQARGLGKADTIATITALTAMSIATAYKDFVQQSCQIEKLILGGGGAENQALCKMLIEFWPHKIILQRHEDYGVSSKYKEALLFALLAYTTHFGIPNNVPRCTGASAKALLGSITRA